MRPWPGTPRPLTRKVLPDDVPAGTRNVTGSSRVGTFTVDPSVGLGERHRRGEGQVAAPAAEDGVVPHPHRHVEVAGGAVGAPGRARGP